MASINEEMFLKGRDLILQENYDEAIQYFNDLQAKDKLNSDVLNYLGIIYVLKENYKEAADYFKKAIEINPDDWYPYQRLGQICSIKKIQKCATDYFTKTIERDPSNIYAIINLALILQRDNAEVAKNLIISALKIDPVHLIANYLMSTICINTCNYIEAEEILNNITEKNPSFLMGWYKLGVLYFKTNKLKKAIDVLEKAASISKKTYILNLLGLIYLHRLKLEEAVAYFKESIKIDPKDPSTWINLADAYFKGNDFKSSIMILKEALQLLADRHSEADNEKQVVVWLNLANCYDKLEKDNFSLYCLEKAREYSMKGINLDLDLFEQDEPKMEMIRKISLSIENLKAKGVTEVYPDDLNMKKLTE